MSGTAYDPGMGRTAFEMQRMLRRSPRTCPICAFVDEGVRNHIDALFYERATDVATRETIRAARGFCRYHARSVSRHADALGTALILKDVLTNDLRDIDKGLYDHPPGKSTSGLRLFGPKPPHVPERAECPLCVVEADIEALAVDSFFEGLGDGEFSALFRQSEGLCIPHFRLGYERCRDETRWATVVEIEKEALHGLTAELEALSLKYDYRSHDQPSVAEADAWRHGLNVTSKRIEE